MKGHLKRPQGHYTNVPQLPGNPKGKDKDGKGNGKGKKGKDKKGKDKRGNPPNYRNNPQRHPTSATLAQDANHCSASRPVE
eukprot:1686210-Amphidinium_carterae.1